MQHKVLFRSFGSNLLVLLLLKYIIYYQVEDFYLSTIYGYKSYFKTVSLLILEYDFRYNTAHCTVISLKVELKINTEVCVQECLHALCHACVCIIVVLSVISVQNKH